MLSITVGSWHHQQRLASIMTMDWTEDPESHQAPGFPWHKEKGDMSFTPIMTFHGFLLDIPWQRFSCILLNDSNS